MYLDSCDSAYQCLSCDGVGTVNIPEAPETFGPRVSLGSTVRCEVSGRLGMVVASRFDRLAEIPLTEFLVSFVDGGEAWMVEGALEVADEDSQSPCSPAASSMALRKTSRTTDRRASIRRASPSSDGSDRESMDGFMWDTEDEMEHRAQRTSTPKTRCRSRSPALATATAGIDDRLLRVAMAEMKRGMAMADAAKMLKLEVAKLEAALAHEGRELDINWQERLDVLISEDPELCCPVSLELFMDPVIASDNFVYEKASLEDLLGARMASPMTREELKTDFVPAQQQRRDAIRFRETRSEELLNFAEKALAPQPSMATAALKQASEYIECLGAKQVPRLAGQAAALWRRLGQSVPQSLLSF